MSNLSYIQVEGKQNQKKQITPYRLIRSFVESKVDNSVKTATEYLFDIEQFFKIRAGKQIKFLTETDLEVNILEVMEYRREIESRFSYANSSINRKISTLRVLYTFLEPFYANANIRACAFNVEALSHDVQHYDSLTLDEIESFCAFALEEKNKAWEKHYLIKLAQRVSFRSNVLLNLKWSDISKHEFRNDCYMVTGRGGKGNKTHKRPIHIDFYNELLTLKDKYDKSYDDDLIFHLTKMDTSRMIERFCQRLNIDRSSRNIVFHSLRRFGCNFIKNVTGDITLAKEQLDHEDIRTTMIYADENGNVDLSVGMLLDGNENSSIIEEMTAEEWKKLFLKSSKETQLNLVAKAKEML